MHTYSSDAEWYCTHGDHDDSRQYYDIFFSMCRKYGIRWTSATEKEKEKISCICIGDRHDIYAGGQRRIKRQVCGDPGHWGAERHGGAYRRTHSGTRCGRSDPG